MQSKEELLRPNFVQGLRATCQRSGPTVATVLEEQLHALVVSAVHSRMSCAKDCSIAMAEVFRVDLIFQVSIFSDLNISRVENPKSALNPPKHAG